MIKLIELKNKIIISTGSDGLLLPLKNFWYRRAVFLKTLNGEFKCSGNGF